MTRDVIDSCACHTLVSVRVLYPAGLTRMHGTLWLKEHVLFGVQFVKRRSVN